ncbi:MAG: anti-sigma regulatory factor [Candidatus Aminicenantes bacterium]|jgi:anti-sigma regulatory factor (Ser/Thr protein kinase)
MESESGLSESYTIKGGDFSNAGVISTKVKKTLQELGIPANIITRTAIASYEAEMNVVMYAEEAVLTLNLTPQAIHIRINDKGPGIEDINLAMKEGFSTATPKMREMGFGAGMGLPNIKKNADKFELSSVLGEGTTYDIYLYLDGQEHK